MFSPNPSKQQVDLIAEPIKLLSENEIDYMVRDTKGNYSDRWSYLQKPYEAEKALCITANVSKGVPYNVVAEPIQVGAMPRPNGELSTSQGFRIYSVDAKSVGLKGNAGGAGGKTGLYAIRADGKETHIYEVKDGLITIKGKQYPIKLKDGYYIIRKLTVSECKRLQTVPEWYDFSCVSNSQAYKMLGNGWTCEVITHLIKSCLNDKPEEYRCNETEAGMQYTLF